MKPAPFTYHRATSAREAVDMLAAAGDDGSGLGGGQSPVPLMNFRVAQPAHLVDINYVDELDYVRIDDGALAIGARTRQATLERSADVARAAPLLREAIEWGAPPRGSAAGRWGGPPPRRCAIAARSSAASSTPTRPPSCPRACSPSTARSSCRARAASGGGPPPGSFPAPPS